MNKKGFFGGMMLPLFSMMMGCGPNCDDSFMASYLKDYHESQTEKVDLFNPGYSIYFDLSDGMAFAYKNDTLNDYLQGITNKVDMQWNSFGLGSLKIDSLNLTKKELYNKVINEPYKDIKAPIEEAFKQIVSDGKLSVLISDLEEYEPERNDTRIQYSAYASKYFTEWIRRNGQIYFYVMDFLEPMNKKEMKKKHLYFVLFDDLEGTLKGKVEQALAGRPVAYENFLLSNKFYSLETQYLSATKGGNYHDSKGEDLVSVVNESDPSVECYLNHSEEAWEFYPCNAAWKDIIANSVAMREEGVPRTDRYHHLLGNLFLNVNSDDSYVIKDLKIKVFNVQRDFAAYANYQNALTCPPAVTTQEGETFVDLGANPYTKRYYDEVSGSLLPEYAYSQPLPCVEVRDMFDVSLIPSEEKPSRSEIVIDFSDKFVGDNANVAPGDMLKIEVSIGDCEINYDKMKNYFVWQDVARQNKSIEESLRNTLQADGINPTGKVIYTYYIKAY